MAGINHMNCCGIRELYCLSEMKLTPKGAEKYLRDVKAYLTEPGHYEEIYNYDTGTYENGDYYEEVVHTPAFFVFSQAGDESSVEAAGAYGDYFKKFIESQGLGTVQETEPALNENSGNLVKVFLWTVNQDAYKAWTGIPAKAKKEAA